MNVTTLGKCGIRSARSGFISDEERIPEIIRRQPGKAPEDGFLFELAGPREWLFFDPKQSRAGIVTCGGLCPGLNNVVRSQRLIGVWRVEALEPAAGGASEAA